MEFGEGGLKRSVMCPNTLTPVFINTLFTPLSGIAR